MLSVDLAELYGVATRILNQAVKRNKERLPNDFMFQLDNSEAELLVSQNVIPHKKYFGGHLPYAFTEQGVAMLSSVLNSERAIKMNIAIMRAFVKLRETISANKEIAIKFNELESKIEGHDKSIKAIFDYYAQNDEKRIPVSFDRLRTGHGNDIFLRSFVSPEDCEPPQDDVVGSKGYPLKGALSPSMKSPSSKIRPNNDVYNLFTLLLTNNFTSTKLK